MGGGCCVSPHSLEGSRAQGAIGRHGAAPPGPRGDFGIPMQGQGLDPGVGHAGGGWGRTRSRPRWVLFPTGPGILGAKAKRVIKEGRGEAGGGSGDVTTSRPTDGCSWGAWGAHARCLPGPRSSGPPPSSPAGGACGVFAAPCGVCGGGAGGEGGCGGAGDAAVPGATAWLMGGQRAETLGGVREPPSLRPIPTVPPDPTNVLCRAVWASPTCRCCGT